MTPETFLPKGSGYRNLLTYKISQYIQDLTVVFVRRFIPRGSRTTDQMEQAARSGKQNIAEGSAASSTSKETEIKLTNVAKASLEELLLDYEDFLRQHNLRLWESDNPRQIKLKRYILSERFKQNPVELAEKFDAEEYCNLCITLIHQCTFLLERQLAAQQRQFQQQGGIKEAMFRARTRARGY